MTGENEQVLVVARYREDISWIEAVDSPAIIYDKFYPSERVLPNIGRESHTYLHYIIENYHCLPRSVVFSQGEPFDHQPRFVEIVNDLPANIGFKGLSEEVITFDRFGRPQHPTDLPMDRFHRMLFGEAFPGEDSCHIAGLFAVSRTRILKRGIKFYQRCKELLSREPNPVEGFVFERIWHRIFS